jgi:hypothetical protein
MDTNYRVKSFFETYRKTEESKDRKPPPFTFIAREARPKQSPNNQCVVGWGLLPASYLAVRNDVLRASQFAMTALSATDCFLLRASVIARSVATKQSVATNAFFLHFHCGQLCYCQFKITFGF